MQKLKQTLLNLMPDLGGLMPFGQEMDWVTVITATVIHRRRQ